MSRDRAIVIGACIASAALLFAASRLMPGIDRQRAELGLTADPDIKQNLPPEVALTQAALGSFRGLAVDYFWIRLQRLKDEGKHYEAMELSRWITMLQPRYWQVWEYHAWNLAFNVSEAVERPEEKWEWVQAGIQLLRDEGIPRNPEALKLYEALADIYFRRIARYSHLTQDYFKLRHAREWHGLLGAPPKGDPDEILAWFAPIAHAPRSLEDLYRGNPEARAEAEKLRALGFDLNLNVLQAVAVAQAALPYADAEGRLAGLPEGVAVVPGLLAWVRDETARPEREALLGFVRARTLRETYRMDPAFMRSLMEEFGPIDWRHASAQTMYWSLLGSRRVQGKPHEDLFDLVQTDRLFLSGLKDLAFGGSVSYDPLAEFYNLTPEPRMLEGFEKAYTEASLRQHKEGEIPDEFKENHRGFLMEAATLTYLYGRPEQAQAFYEKLARLYGDRADYTRPLRAFVEETLEKELDQPQQTGAMIQGILANALLEGLAAGREEVAEQLFRLAGRLYERHQTRQAKLPPGAVRIVLPRFERLRGEVLRDFLLDPSHTHLLRARVWNRAPLPMRQEAFDEVREALYEQARAAKVDPAAAYPEPPGMDAFRKEKKVDASGLFETK